MNRTPLQLHTEEWKQCTKCQYSERRRKVVIGKGSSPCDILFVGEAPGDSENSLGIPFAGQAGRLLDTILLLSGAKGYRTAFSNLVACIPLALNEKSGRWEKEDPDHDCIMNCKPRLEEFVKIVSPRLIVTVGKQATEYLDQNWAVAIKARFKDGKAIPQTGIIHPSAILRSPFIQRDMLVQKSVAAIKRAIRETFES